MLDKMPHNNFAISLTFIVFSGIKLFMVHEILDIPAQNGDTSHNLSAHEQLTGIPDDLWNIDDDEYSQVTGSEALSKWIASDPSHSLEQMERVGLQDLANSYGELKAAERAVARQLSPEDVAVHRTALRAPRESEPMEVTQSGLHKVRVQMERRMRGEEPEASIHVPDWGSSGSSDWQYRRIRSQ